jgi:hypothetical protein
MKIDRFTILYSKDRATIASTFGRLLRFVVGMAREIYL